MDSLNTRGLTSAFKSLHFTTGPSLSLPHTLCFLFPLGSLSVRLSPWMTFPVNLNVKGNSRATVPHGEGKETGGVGPCSISVLGRVERPQRGLGHSPSLLLSDRKLIGTALVSRTHGWECWMLEVIRLLMHVREIITWCCVCNVWCREPLDRSRYWSILKHICSVSLDFQSKMSMKHHTLCVLTLWKGEVL